jgi:hypothetical protein
LSFRHRVTGAIDTPLTDRDDAAMSENDEEE